MIDSLWTFNMPIEKGIREHYHNADTAFLYVRISVTSYNFGPILAQLLNTFKFILFHIFPECVNYVLCEHGASRQ